MRSSGAKALNVLSTPNTLTSKTFWDRSVVFHSTWPNIPRPALATTAHNTEEEKSIDGRPQPISELDPNIIPTWEFPRRSLTSILAQLVRDEVDRIGETGLTSDVTRHHGDPTVVRWPGGVRF